MASLDEDIHSEEFSVPTSSSSTPKDKARVVHTIVSSASFDSPINVESSSGANANETLEVDTERANTVPNTIKSEQAQVVRVSPNSLQINQSFSDNNNPKGTNSRRTNSIESFASGELIRSDSIEFPLETYYSEQQPNKIPSPKELVSFESTSIASSYEEEIKTDSSEEDESDELDSEVLLAKEMALAIAKNPSMTPTLLRELQQQVQQKVEQKRNEIAIQKANKKERKKSMKASLVMKNHYTETKLTAKKAYKKMESKSKSGANHIRNEAKKGLRAAGLIRQSSSDEAAAQPAAVERISSHTTDSTSRSNLDVVDDDQKVRVAGIIWKRRSGLGKYSMTAPWERRRVVLQGSRLIYYKTLQETGGSDGEDDEEEHSNSNENDNLGLGYGTSAHSDDNSGWINTIMDKTGVSIPWESSSSSTARGYLDLRKEKASASASYGHTGAPTPFALSIKVASTGTTKYKFCFETQQELMQWLSAITDVVVAGSVDAYNAEILEANDPSMHGDAVSAIAAFGVQEASPRNANASHQEGRGHQLWATEKYQVSNDDTYSASNSSSNSKRRESMVKSSSIPKMEETVGGRSEDYLVDTSTADDFVAIPFKYMEPAIYIINAVILVSKAETSLSNEWFWYLLVFFNLLGVFVVTKVQVGGTIKIKPELEGDVGNKIKKNKPKVDGALPTIQSVDSSDTTSSLVDENFVPPAGSTSLKIENPTDLPTKDGVIFPGWREVNASDLMVRGAGYKTDKLKVPCPQSLYQCVEIDVFESRARVPDMAGRVILPTVNFDDGNRPKTWNAPDQFVITLALPTDPPKLYGGSSDNGGGYTITMYCVMRQETRDILRRVTADGYNPSDDKEGRSDPNKSMVNAVKLFDEWCRRAPSDDSWMARFKVVPQGNNLAEIGLPSWISQYNGKPFLIKRPGTTGFLYRHPDKSCMEFDVSLHPFPYLAKQGICYMKDGFFKKILATLAFCIEGRSEDELPECLIGLYQLVSQSVS